MLGIDDIKQKLTVRVNDGTGVLVSPLDKDILYVFTCRHVVLDEGKNILPIDNISISYDEANSKQAHVFTIQSVEVSEQVDNDIAVLVVKRDIDIPHLYISSDRIGCFHIGFPKSRKNAEDKIGNTLVLHIAHFDSNSETDIVEYQYDVNNKENEIKGMSGGGILNKDCKLVGIHTQSAMHDKQEMLGKCGMIPISLFLQLIAEKKLPPVLKFDLSYFGKMVGWVFDFSCERFVDDRTAQFTSDLDQYKAIVEQWSPIRIFDVLIKKGKINEGTKLEGLDQRYWQAFTLFIVGVIALLDLNEPDGEKAIVSLYEKFHYCYSNEELDVYDVREKLEAKLVVGKIKGAYLVVGGLNKTVFYGNYAAPKAQVPDLRKAEIIEENDISRSRSNVFNQMTIINNNIFETAVKDCANTIKEVTIEHYRNKLKEIIEV
ncbi:S1 family peptidase [Prevotella merdae]|uniref:S1 family peptidase n=1 Tax=Prevotella merdae TaxID=2079531 RepID=UPI000D0F903E|nr:serine protease [Prevotella merdae]